MYTYNTEYNTEYMYVHVQYRVHVTNIVAEDFLTILGVADGAVVEVNIATHSVTLPKWLQCAKG